MSSFEDFIKTWRGGYLVETDNDHSNAQYAAALAAWRAAQLKWQPIETAPDREPVLACFEELGDIYIAVASREGEDWWTDTCGDVMEANTNPTHWMPLPQPPKEQ